MRILHVIPHALPGAATFELDLLLTQRGNDHQICCLGEDSLASHAWRTAGITVDVLNWKRLLDPRPLWSLAGCIRAFQPDVIHAWGLPSLRAVTLAARKSDALIAVRKPIPLERSLTSFDRWLLRRADRVLARSSAEAARCTHAGVAAHKLHVVPPGVREIPIARRESNPLILCLGDLLAHKGYYDAIWAFDILHFAHSTVELSIIGEGPDRRRLQQLANTMGAPQRIHLPGEAAVVESWLARASLVWIPSLTDNGITATLTAMAAGKAVIAYRRPSLAEFIVHGETGFLVEPGNKMELASLTSQLLMSAARLRRLGETGRQRAQASFSQETFRNSWTSAVAEPNSAETADPRAAMVFGK